MIRVLNIVEILTSKWENTYEDKFTISDLVEIKKDVRPYDDQLHVMIKDSKHKLVKNLFTFLGLRNELILYTHILRFEEISYNIIRTLIPFM